MRLFFFLLVLANLVFFVWTQGYLGASGEDREPQRLANQVNADKLRLVRNAKASPNTGEPACRLINGLGTADAETLKAAVAAIGGDAKVLPLAEPTLHLVFIAELANKAAATKKAAELTRFGIAEQKLVALEGGRHEIILGSFSTEAAAREFLQGLTRKGIKSARLDSREQPATKAAVEARAAASVLLQQLPKLIAPHAGATVGECAP